MTNDLYKIELVANVSNSAIADGVGMLYTANGLAFVKLRPVKVRATPKVDVVEVVRCGECKHWGDAVNGFNDWHVCERLTNPPHLYSYRSKCDYCSYGERKDDE